MPLGPSTPGGPIAGYPGGGTPPGGFIPLPIGGVTGVPISNGCVPKPDKPCKNPPPPPLEKMDNKMMIISFSLDLNNKIKTSLN